MQRGFASVLALLAAVLLLGLGSSQNRSQNAFFDSFQGMIEAEQNNFVRSMLEESTDTVIEKTLEEALLSGETDPETINRQIAWNLAVFFRETESQNSNIEFYWVETTPESYNRIPLLETNSLDAATIESFSKTIVIRNGSIAIGETVFVGGKNQNRAIVAHIHSPNHSDFFLLPIGYQARTEVVV
jgi:type II secretory pathway pseudopilin PulG